MKDESKNVGRPHGRKKPEGTRKQRQLRAYDDEWILIQQFAKMLKHGDKDACKKFLGSQS